MNRKPLDQNAAPGLRMGCGEPLANPLLDALRQAARQAEIREPAPAKPEGKA